MENLSLKHLTSYLTLTAEEKQAIIDLDLIKHYKRGTILIREGQISDNGFFVIKGCIRCYYVHEGQEKTTTFYTEAESFSPPCSINKMPSAYYVSCVEDCILIVANLHMGIAIFDKLPRFEICYRTFLGELLAKTNAEFDEFKILSPQQRYLSVLQKKPNLIQRVPLQQLASYLGITAPSLSRIRARITKFNQSEKTLIA